MMSRCDANAPPTYEVYAVRYATLPRFRVSGLDRGRGHEPATWTSR